MLLVLAHLFRQRGNPVPIDEAVHFLSFKCRYGPPTDVRKMLSVAVKKEMISLNKNGIRAEFLFNEQILPLNLSCALEDKIRFKDDIEPIY